MIDAKHCEGCRDDFYNGHNDLGVQKCFLRDKAHIVARYRIHRDSLPDTKGAFTEVTVPDCKHGNGWFYVKALPGFVKPENVRRTVPAS